MNTIHYTTNTIVNFRGRASTNQITQGITSNSRILCCSKNVNVSIRNHNTSSSHILNRKLRLTMRSTQTTNRTTQMISTQTSTNILHLERIKINIIHTKKGKRILDFETINDGTDEIFSLLKKTRIGRVFAGTDLDAFVFEIHADLELALLDDGSVDFDPDFAKRRKSVMRNFD